MSFRISLRFISILVDLISNKLKVQMTEID